MMMMTMTGGQQAAAALSIASSSVAFWAFSRLLELYILCTLYLCKNIILYM